MLLRSGIEAPGYSRRCTLACAAYLSCGCKYASQVQSKVDILRNKLPTAQVDLIPRLRDCQYTDVEQLQQMHRYVYRVAENLFLLHNVYHHVSANE